MPPVTDAQRLAIAEFLNEKNFEYSMLDDWLASTHTPEFFKLVPSETYNPSTAEMVFLRRVYPKLAGVGFDDAFEQFATILFEKRDAVYAESTGLTPNRDAATWMLFAHVPFFQVLQFLHDGSLKDSDDVETITSAANVMMTAEATYDLGEFAMDFTKYYVRIAHEHVQAEALRKRQAEAKGSGKLPPKDATAPDDSPRP